MLHTQKNHHSPLFRNLKEYSKKKNSTNTHTCSISLSHTQTQTHINMGVVKTVCEYHFCRSMNCTFHFHPLYSLDLVPNDLHLITHMEQFFDGTRMRSNKEVKNTVTDWFNWLAAISTMQAYRNLSHGMQNAWIFMRIMYKNYLRPAVMM